ncbi:uncharacterized protein LOC129582223 isoform X2 [Paramacrobiotus metropolitanus]|uniref:uncharacterized protein LOC129582223 isoform X2 n=1 Tax=Paramacrobiotus metropolitanus TaxID=2943436 RepID=UPI002445DE96|nr:uncharacterized protein LOC129582223 isoform X2 [Paramacrobiotus metropolitanus]
MMPGNPTYHIHKTNTFPQFQSQAVVILESLPENVKTLLPPVDDNALLFKLFSKKEFVNLNDLLLNNRTPHASSSSKSNASKIEQIRDHHQWSRAFNVLKMYRCAIYPELWLPMTKYMDHIAQIAAPKGITPEQWLAYDRQFRLAICRNPDDAMQWSRKNDDAYAEYLSQPLGLDFDQPAVGVGKTIIQCFHCLEYGHIRPECPLLRSATSNRRTSWVGQSFLNFPAGNGGPKPDEICQLWNKGQCTTGLLCRYGRQHRCANCGQREHREPQCKAKVHSSNS